MKKLFTVLLAAFALSGSLSGATLENHPQWKSDKLPDLYYEVLARSVQQEQKLISEDGRFRSQQPASPAEEEGRWRITGMQFIYAPALLYTCTNPANPLQGGKKVLELALRAGDYLVTCVEPDGRLVPKVNGKPVDDLDNHRTLYCWTEAFGLLEKSLDPARRKSWREALQCAGGELVRDIQPRLDRPRFTSPFIGYSPNHFGLRATTIWRMGMVLGNPDWVSLVDPALRRFVLECRPGGYWEEHNGPTMNYDYLNSSVAAIYWHYTSDPAAWTALRNNTDYHIHWCTPDGVDIHTVDQRNRNDFRPEASWGLFTFCHFPQGRRFARFKLLAALGDSDNPLESLGLESLARIAQDAHYHTEGGELPIPQELPAYRHLLDRPAVVKKEGPWVYSMSALISPERPLSQFYLDRTAPISLWHAATGHIIGGGNSKGQPELATFAVKRTSTGQWSWLPLDALLSGGWDADTLAVAHEGFSLRLTISLQDSGHATISVQAQRTYDVPDTCFLNLPLRLFPGRELKAGDGTAFKLSKEEIRLSGASLGGRLEHNGWKMELPAGARFSWPFYTYSPYGSVRVPENLEAALGVVSIPLNGDSGWVRVRFSVETRK